MLPRPSPDSFAVPMMASLFRRWRRFGALGVQLGALQVEEGAFTNRAQGGQDALYSESLGDCGVFVSSWSRLAATKLDPAEMPAAHKVIVQHEGGDDIFCRGRDPTSSPGKR